MYEKKVHVKYNKIAPFHILIDKLLIVLKNPPIENETKNKNNRQQALQFESTTCVV